MRKYTVNIKDKDYNLVLTRDGVKWLEARGFTIEEFYRKPITYQDLLWHVGFLQDYPSVHDGLAEKLRESYEAENGDVNDVIIFMIEEYTNFLNAQADTDSKKKKGKIVEA